MSFRVPRGSSRLFGDWVSIQFTRSFSFRSTIGPYQQVHRSVDAFKREVIVRDKFRMSTVSEQVWLVFCCTCHESIHSSGSWPFIDSAHVMVHAEVAVACVC